MIKRLFLPEKVGSYYLFGKRVIGISIGSQSIHAASVSLKGHSRIIEKLIEEPLLLEGGLTYDERVIHALRALTHKLGSYDELCCIIPSAHVVFKNLRLPFTGLKKIKMVVPFEVEPLLPFTLDQAVLDSIITHEDTTKKQTDILVCAVKKEIIERYTHYFSSAGLPLHKISVDMIELYGLYKLLEEKDSPQEAVGLVAMEYDATGVALIHNGQLIAIRSLSNGIISVAKTLTTVTHGDVPETIKMLLRSGVDESRDSGSAHASQQAFDQLISEIRFTYATATKKLEPPQELSHIILVGAAGDIPGITDFLKRELELPVKLLEPKKLIHNEIIKSTVSSLPNSFMLSVATALSPNLTDDFNIHRQEALHQETKTITKQLTTAGALLALMLGSFILYSFFRVRALRIAFSQGQTEALTALKRSFKLKPGQTTTLAQANKAAQTELTLQEATWHSLSKENRYAFLKYLSELSKCLNIKDTQLDLTSIVITDTVIKLYGSVPGYPQLTKLQSQLECPLFKRLPKLQDWNFKSEQPITLTINKEEV